MDDDPIVLRFLIDVLDAAGHEVVAVQAVDGADLARCADALAAGPLDALVVDLRMPLDTAHVVAMVRAAAPAATVVLCTGTEVLPEDLERIAPDALLMKPFAAEALLRMIAAPPAGGRR
ncbi:MAG: response regulator [Planctomycetes bacterium]|nr:response regulator [Planctomycetota bacterium]